MTQTRRDSSMGSVLQVDALDGGESLQNLLGLLRTLAPRARVAVDLKSCRNIEGSALRTLAQEIGVLAARGVLVELQGLTREQQELVRKLAGR